MGLEIKNKSFKKLGIGCLLTFILLGFICGFLYIIYLTPYGYWKRAYRHNPESAVMHSFPYFLATQQNGLFDITSPSQHDRLRDWMLNHKPMDCPFPPMTMGGANNISVRCQCRLEVTGIEMKAIEKEPYWIITDWSTVEIDTCFRNDGDISPFGISVTISP